MNPQRLSAEMNRPYCAAAGELWGSSIAPMNIADGLIISHSVTSMEGNVELLQLRFSLSIGRELLVANNTNHEILSSIIGSRTSPTVSDEDIRALTQRNTI